jgi:hypothetical protein
MSNKIPGTTPVTGEMAPYQDDVYALLDEKHYRGGYKSVSGITERNAITKDRRSLGMLVHDVDESANKYWVLIFNPDTPGTLNEHWEEFIAGGSSGTDGTSGSSGTDGTPGSSGIDGTDGTSGSSGVDGQTYGTDGTSGSSGVDGQTYGTDGTS